MEEWLDLRKQLKTIIMWGDATEDLLESSEWLDDDNEEDNQDYCFD